MSLWRQLKGGLRGLTRRSAVDREIAEEVEHYLDEATAEHLARGLSPDEALRAARLELGGVTSVRERVREYGWEHAVETVWADLYYAARRLRGEPMFTAAVVLTLALGLGGASTIFSAISPVLLEPLPYPEPGRLAMIREIGLEGSRLEGTFGMYREMAARARSFEALAVLKAWRPTMTGADRPERLDGQRVSAGYFDVLGVAPALGRAFDASEDRLGGANVVILSDGLWRRRYAADPDVVGSSIVLDGDPYVVIGIMPDAFENLLAPTAELWAALQYDMSQGRAWGHHLRTVGRLRPGLDSDEATRELDSLGRAVLSELHPPTYGSEVDFVVVALRGEVTGGVKPALLAIFGAVILLLIIACVNVTNLQLARDARRRRELALRAALGAPRGRLVRQLLTEGMLLAAIGGAAGMAVAVLGVRALVALSPPDLPRAGAIGVDGGVFAFGLTVTTLVGLACAAIPAREASRVDPRAAVLQGSLSVGGHRRSRRVLVVAEVALAFVLLVGAGLLLRSLERLLAVEPGFEASHLLTMQVQTSGRAFEADDTTRRFFEQALAAVERLPGVTAAAMTSQLPLSGDVDRYGVHFDPPLADDPGEVLGTFRYAVSPGYFRTMGIPLVRGRLLSDGDRADAPLAALISESLAQRRLPGLDPIGRRLRIGSGPLYTVVGVVGDVRQLSLALAETDAVYVTAGQWRFADSAMSLVVRSRVDAAALAPAVRQAVWSVDKDQPVVRAATMDDLLAASAAERRFALIVFEAFALAALLLAAGGIYAVLAGSVAERTQEIGLRSALGASRRDILAVVLREGMTLAGLGVAIGVVGAGGTTQALAALLFGLSRLDPVTYLAGIAVLAAVSMIACALPAWHASRVDPASVLRSERP